MQAHNHDHDKAGATPEVQNHFKQVFHNTF
jgi:hypothetical protein